jgi:NADPH:quinone reductase-like Zn-dependent oxidoreductase
MKGLQVRTQASHAMNWVTMPKPTPGIGDVLLEVAAASFTPTELEWPSTWVDRGGRGRAPAVPGHEVSGTVAALGDGTTGLAVGDEVYGMTDWYRDGAIADFVAVEARNLAPRPSSISLTEAAALPLAGLTAWQGLFVHGGLKKGQSVVITGASGGVGVHAVQLARNAGAQVIGVARQWARDFLVDDLGVDAFVDGDDLDASEFPPGDLLFDLVGGQLAADCATKLRSGAPVISIVDPEPAVPSGSEGLYFIVEPDRPQLLELKDTVDSGHVRAVIAQVIDMAESASAFDAQGRKHAPGKVVFERRAEA